MKESPILFSGEMVQAILDGRKTMTRRVVKPQPYCPGGSMFWHEPSAVWRFHPRYSNPHDGTAVLYDCPYGTVGDRLWVRETWRVYAWQEGDPIRVQYRDGTVRECSGEDDRFDDYERWEERMWIQSGDDCEKAGMTIDGSDVYRWPDGEDRDVPTRWRPSIHVPRWAARLTLEITDVRVERLNDISEEDAKAEGFQATQNERGEGSTAVDWFRNLWDRINGKRFPWAANPWCWAISFRILESET